VTSDNGFFLGERGLADKWLPYEESIRVPLVVLDPRQPAARAGAVVDAMTLNIDLAPTLLDLARVRAPRSMQGRSLSALLDGKSPRGWRKEFFYEHHTRSDIIPPKVSAPRSGNTFAMWAASRSSRNCTTWPTTPAKSETSPPTR